MNTDFIYYLSVEGNLLETMIFKSEEEAEQYAKEQGYEDFWVLKWSVD